MLEALKNPYQPGAGRQPPYLAGRDTEMTEFRSILQLDDIIQNVVLTGLRGVGKTVLMDEYKRIASAEGWIWVGSDLSEAAFVDERTICNRLLTDFSLFTSTIVLSNEEFPFGFQPRKDRVTTSLDYHFLMTVYERQPGLNADRLKATFEYLWKAVESTGQKGVLFAYDESQVVQDRREKDEYPLALLLETFQSLQRKDMRYMLLLTGLPTLFPKLVESRTYAERMFTIQEVGRLDTSACREAIENPLLQSPLTFTPESVEEIIEISAGYPYFLQFICRESFDYLKLQFESKPGSDPSIPVDTLVSKLDSDFFAGRWNKVTDRQRELLLCIASLEHSNQEFTISEIVDASKVISGISKPFRTGHISQMLPKLIDQGLIYKNRHGKYSFAVPLFDGYIKRQF